MENETTLKDQVEALKRFEEWLHSTFEKRVVRKVYQELSTIGSRRVDTSQINILLFPLDSIQSISQVVNQSFEREEVEYTIHLASNDD